MIWLQTLPLNAAASRVSEGSQAEQGYMVLTMKLFFQGVWMAKLQENSSLPERQHPRQCPVPTPTLHLGVWGPTVPTGLLPSVNTPLPRGWQDWGPICFQLCTTHHTFF